MAVKRLVSINGKVAWAVSQSATTNRWIAVCDELNLATEGNSLDELFSLIPETIHLLMLDLFAENEFDKYLQDRGWTATGDALPDPSLANEDDLEFHFPFQMIAEGGLGDSERRAH